MRQLLLVGALCLVGCTTDDIATEPPAGYPQAYAMNDCAPWDGPAISVLLTAHATDSLDAAFPMVRLMIYPRGEQVEGRTYRWPEQPETAVGIRCDTANNCVTSTSGEITLTEMRPDTTVGRARLAFPGGEEISGSFRAAWLQRQILCG